MAENGMFAAQKKKKELPSWTSILKAYNIESYKMEWNTAICKIYYIEGNKRWLCFFQISTQEKEKGFNEIYSVFQFVSYCMIRTLSVPISIGYNKEVKYTEILEEFAGHTLIKLLKEHKLTAEEKVQLYWKVLYEGAYAIMLMGGKMYHSNFCIQGLLIKYHTIKFAFSSLGKLTPDGTIPQDTMLNIINYESMAPEIAKNVDGMMRVTSTGISSEKADINSLGMCLFLLIGEFGPGDGNAIASSRRDKYSTFLAKVESIKEKVPESLFNIITKMLVEDPKARISAKDILALLRSGISKSPAERIKVAMPDIGYAPESKTKVLMKARLDPNIKIEYVRSEQTGSMFMVNTVAGKYMLLKMYVSNMEEVKAYEALFSFVEFFCRNTETNIIAKPMAFDYDIKEYVCEWLDEYAGVTIENLHGAQKAKGESFLLSDILMYFKGVLNLLIKFKNLVFLSRVSKSSLLFHDGEVRWCNFRFAYIIEKSDGIVPENAKLSHYYKLTAAPELLNGIDEVSIVKKPFKSTPADLYSLAIVIVSLLCDMDAEAQIQLVELRRMSSDCFKKLLNKPNIPKELSELLINECLVFDPECRSTPEVVLAKLDGINTKAENITQKVQEEDVLKNIDCIKTESKYILKEKKVEIPKAELKKSEIQKRKYMFSKTNILNRFKEIEESIWKYGGQGIILKVNAETMEGKQEIYALKRMAIPQDQEKQQTRIWEQVKGIKHCVKVFDFEYSKYSEMFEVLMEFCEGTLSDLKEEYIKKGAKFIPNSELMLLFRQCVEAMADIQDLSAKKVHFYHGDLNPKNILLKGKEIRIADFGCSKIAGASTIIIKVGIEGYTPLYAAPEILREELKAEVGMETYVKGDVFSLGMSFLEIASLWKIEDMFRFVELRKDKGTTLQDQIDLIKEGEDPVKLSIKPILKEMLEPKYDARIDFKTILKKYFT